MPEHDRYAIKLVAGAHVNSPVALAGMGLIGLAAGVWSLYRADLYLLPFGVFFLYLGFAGFYEAATSPSEILLRDDSKLELRSASSVRFVEIADLVRIAPHPFRSAGYLRFQHKGGSETVMMRFDGFYELLYSIKQINPEVEIVGC